MQKCAVILKHLRFFKHVMYAYISVWCISVRIYMNCVTAVASGEKN